MSFRVTGTGAAVPAHILTNDDLSRMVDTSDEWITGRTGIRRRHIMTTETLEELSARAARAALDQAGVLPEDLDLILCATMQGDYVTPALACCVQRSIGAFCPAMDINAACSGFLYALDVAAGYFARGRVRRVLVVAAECMSRHVDWQDRATCVLFGDGAGAVVLEAGDALLASWLYAQGNDAFLRIGGAESAFPGAAPPAAPPKIEMNGQEVYRFAVNAMCREIELLLEEARVDLGQVRYVLVHQANLRILEAARARMGIREDQLVITVDRYGNTSAASVPLMLDELNRQGRLRSGDLLAMCAFGGGLTVGTALLRWEP